ncbi:hotdog domain-containing protein [Moritella viscosa]
MSDKTTAVENNQKLKLDKSRIPTGSLVLRTLAMPADTNANGDIFGGWIMSQMDIAGGILAKEIAQGRVATISVDGMTFHQPVAVGDVVCC